MKINLFTLSFDEKLENQFRLDYLIKTINQMRISLALAIIFYALFGILDAELIPDQKETIWAIRFGIFCPTAIFVLILSFFKRIQHQIYFWIACVEIVGGVGIICMTVIAPPPANYTYYAGLILVLFFGFTIFRLRFVLATITGWIIVILYQIAALKSNAPMLMYINNNFFFIGANLIGMFACYSRELNERKNFYLAQLLEIEREKVNAANFELENRVNKRTLQLKKMNTDLLKEIEAHKKAENEKKFLETELRQAQKMQAIGTLAGGIAHDFNNILFPIFAYVQMAINETSDIPKVQRYLKRVMNSAERAKDLVQQILMFARKGDQDKKPVYIQTITKEALKLLRATIPANIDIKQDIGKLSPILGSDIQLHQVIMNLCTNAYHAVKEKETSCIEVTVTEKVITKEDNGQFPNILPGKYVYLMIKDTGVGIEDKIKEQIFDPFFTTKEPGEGTGMGLSVVHGIVSGHAGQILVQSTPEKGTQFNVFFPIIDGVVKKEKLEKKSENYRGNGEHILLVDDELEVVKALEQMLKKIGYVVTTELSSKRTLETIEKNPDSFDLLLTDQTMPQMTGMTLAKKVLNIRPDFPIIICSGYSSQLTQENLNAIGVKDILHKPITIKELGKKIRSVLDKK
ncbi:two component system sensor histidine kinase, hybrid [Candidatus Magnetomorum sp. HK-1]|nr:two component system sensor histidine kinase, hybrid [Candidatus Magnetomorum sp. HK-1]